MAGWGHLAGRFIRALRPGPLPAAERAWVGDVLTPEEFGLWERLPGHDHHHTVEVARRVEASLAGGPFAGDGRWPAAALLHDIGKLQSRLRVGGRVLATLVGRWGGRRVDAWTDAAGWRRRVSDYLRHDVIGAEMLRVAGGRPEPAHWAESHHGRTDLDRSLIPVEVAGVLAAADPD